MSFSYYDRRGYHIRSEIDAHDDNRRTIMVQVPWEIRTAKTEWGGWECATWSDLDYDESEKNLEVFLDQLDARKFALKAARSRWRSLWQTFRFMREEVGEWPALEHVKQYDRQGSLILLTLLIRSMPRVRIMRTRFRISLDDLKELTDAEWEQSLNRVR